MKKKISIIFPVISLLLAAALAVSVFALISVKSDVAALEQQVLKLTEDKQQLEALNRLLQMQTSAPAENGEAITEEPYCTMYVDSWSLENNLLTVDTFAQAYLPAGGDFIAKAEIWKDDQVLTSQSIVLEPGESVSSYEASATVKFDMSELLHHEEFELWLMVAPANGSPLFYCAGGWYLENGQLMVIAG